MEDYKEGMKVSITTVIMNMVLALIKLLAGIFGESQGMIADSVHTLTDVVMTIIVIVGLKISSKEADAGHPYGHDKFELIFAKMLSVILILIGGFIGYEAIKSLVIGDQNVPGRIALFAAFISIIFKEAMFRYTIITARKISSVSMEADAWHHRSDAFASIGMFAGILGARLGMPILDKVAAVLVSLIIIKIGVELYIKSVKGLVDSSADVEVVDEIKKIINNIEEVVIIRKLKTRAFSNQIYVDISIVINGALSVYEGYEIAEKVKENIKKEIKVVKDCTVRIEPVTNKKITED